MFGPPLLNMEECAPEQRSADAAEASEDGCSASYCPILGQLAAWNRFLWHVGLQLRELTGPGELSLVRVGHEGSGQLQVSRSCEARYLFHILLTCHRCLVSVELDDLLFQGSGLGEYRAHVIDALRQNTRLRKLRFGSIFGDYRYIQEDVFAAIGTMTHLRELVVSDIGAVPPALVDALHCLLVDTTSLSTLSIAGLALEDEEAKHVVSALMRNRTVAHLSVHHSILLSQFEDGSSAFTRYLSKNVSLRTLYVDGLDSEPGQTRRELAWIAAPLIKHGAVSKLEIVGFALDAGCANVFARLVAQPDGYLRHLDIRGCYWTVDDESPGPAISQHARILAQGLREGRWGHLASLSLSLEGFTPHDCRALFSAAVDVESLQAITISDIEPEDFPEVCQAIQEAGMSGRVRVRGQYPIDAAVIGALEDCPEAVRQVTVSSARDCSADAFSDTVILVCSCYHVTRLQLCLPQESIGDVPTMRSLQRYLSGATSLREIDLMGCQNPDLSGCILVEHQSHSGLLEALFDNVGVTLLRLRNFRFGEANRLFLAGAIKNSRTLCKFTFSSTSENELFARCVAPLMANNDTLVCFQLLVTDGEAEAERFTIEYVLGRNLGFVTCAAHFVTGEVYVARCADALLHIFGSPALIDKVQEIASIDEADATEMIRNVLDIA
ncbi:hypothetical protein HPB49_006614 [Dermacentor silvarum]|uniref:Uncharacterized protein n=1 Tax=Dermacentor silvarum TaxID=543639 RepID=A0ACB8CQ49_DERSI|nr:uncharacterized protein LOC119453986 [Dermacentor silvarum]KAH7949226.1 hypothetical protein HPB49_006614 [Dermacentor silvarum]